LFFLQKGKKIAISLICQVKFGIQRKKLQKFTKTILTNYAIRPFPAGPGIAALSVTSQPGPRISQMTQIVWDKGSATLIRPEDR
jgi:hypothetical protein